MAVPQFTGLSHVCIIVDDIMEAFAYYQRILGAIPNQCIPHYRNQGFFQAAGFVEDAAQGDISIGFLTVPNAQLTLEIMEYHSPRGRTEPVIFGANDVSGARHVALKVSNIEEAFAHIQAQPDATLIHQPPAYRVYQISPTQPGEFYYFDKAREADPQAKEAAAAILGQIKYFYFIDRYGLQWEFEQGHSDIGS